MKENQLLLKDLLEFQKIKSTNKEKEVNDKEPKFKVGDRVRISKCKNIFAKGYTSNWSEEGFVISKIKNTVHGHILLMISMVKILLENFMKMNCKIVIKKNLGQKK